MTDVEQAWTSFGNIVAITGIGFWCAFGLIYIFFTRGWWKSLVGVTLATVALAFMSIGAPVVLALLYGQHYPGKIIIRTIGFTLFGLASALFFLTFLTKRQQSDRPIETALVPSAATPPAE